MGVTPETFCWKPFPVFYLLPVLGGNRRNWGDGRKDITDAYIFFSSVNISVCVYTHGCSFPCVYVWAAWARVYMWVPIIVCICMVCVYMCVHISLCMGYVCWGRLYRCGN